MTEAILFDMDGVIVDSREANIALYQRVMALGGYEKPDREVVLEYFHLPFVNTVQCLIGRNDSAEVERLRTFITEDPGIKNPDLFVFPETLHEDLSVLAKDYRLGVVTSRVHAGVETVFKAYDMRDFFETVVAYEYYSSPKPDPEPLMVALGKLGLLPEAAIYIGDSPTDIEAAHAAGMRSVHLSDDTHPDASVGVTSFAQLVSALQLMS